MMRIGGEGTALKQTVAAADKFEEKREKREKIT